MQVKNIECQIAQAQLRRYLTGEEMPKGLVGDLEAHIKNCNECMAAAQHQRESLSGVLASKIMGKSPVPLDSTGGANAVIKKYTQKRETKQTVVPFEPAKAAVQTPLDILDTPDEHFASKIKKKKISKPSNVKTIAYSVGLAVLLVLMSTVFKDPTSLFGPRASANKQDTPPVESSEPVTKNPKAGTNAIVTPPATTENTEDTEANTDSSTDESTVDTTEATSEKPVSTSKPVEKKPAISNSSTQTGNTVKIGANDIIVADESGATVEKTTKKPSGGGIKVYPPAKK